MALCSPSTYRRLEHSMVIKRERMCVATGLNRRLLWVGLAFRLENSTDMKWGGKKNLNLHRAII